MQYKAVEENDMKWLRLMLLFVITPAIGLVLGCLGVRIIGETPLGWLLLAVGVGYPAGVILVEMRRDERKRSGIEAGSDHGNRDQRA
jgi:hypothetical protein